MELWQSIVEDTIWLIWFFSIIWWAIFGLEAGVYCFLLVYFLQFSQVIYDAIKRYQPNVVNIKDATLEMTGTNNINNKSPTR